MGEHRGFAGLRVLTFESRMAEEMEQLVRRYGGEPVVAPALREVPLEDSTEVIEFGRALMGDGFDVVIFLTGVGTRRMAQVLETGFPKAAVIEALSRVVLVARGPKPVAALKELGLTPDISVPEPNTWRDILQAFDEAAKTLEGLRIAVQEYGVPNQEFLEALRARGAIVTRVPVYQWALPEDQGPLRQAVADLVATKVDVVMLTNAAQLDHLFEVAGQDERRGVLRDALGRVVVISIGPTVSERLAQYGLSADFVPSHPKMGVMVKEASERAGSLVQGKRQLKN